MCFVVLLFFASQRCFGRGFEQSYVGCPNVSSKDRLLFQTYFRYRERGRSVVAWAVEKISETSTFCYCHWNVKKKQIFGKFVFFSCLHHLLAMWRISKSRLVDLAIKNDNSSGQLTLPLAVFSASLLALPVLFGFGFWYVWFPTGNLRRKTCQEKGLVLIKKFKQAIKKMKTNNKGVDSYGFHHKLLKKFKFNTISICLHLINSAFFMGIWSNSRKSLAKLIILIHLHGDLFHLHPI